MSNNYPILLAHGIARFDFLRDNLLGTLRSLFADEAQEEWDQTHYFKGVASHLRDHGFSVHHSAVPFAGGVADRAEQLARDVDVALEHSGASKIHIVGHSMGGLDGRYAVVHAEGMAEKVASLTTIGTPHNGTSFADFGMKHHGDKAVKILGELIDLDGFLSLTLEDAKKFNDEARNVEATNAVEYHTYSSHQEQKLVFTPLKFSWKVIHDEKEGDNDGLVPVSSQRWTSELVSDDGPPKKIHQHEFPISADHLNQVGWWDWSELTSLPWYKRLPWHKRNAISEKARFDAAVQSAYLAMARNVQRI